MTTPTHTDAPPALDLLDITKVYRGGKRAVDRMTLRMEPGLLGLLGPNGAGKSSLMRIASTVTRPTEGRVLFRGEDAVAKPDVLRRELGYLPQDFGVYPNLTSRQFLSYLAAAKGLSARSARARIDELLELVNLTEAVKRPLGAYSGGMVRRVGIAQALLAAPSVIIVDEPTAGLDPEERVRFRNLLSDLSATRAVMLSTHIVSDVESVASDIAVVAGGRLLRRGSPEELLADVRGRAWEVLVAPSDVPALQHHHLVTRTIRTNGGVRVRLLSDSAPPFATAQPAEPDLEDAYLSIVNTPRTPDPAAPAAPATTTVAGGMR
ncbi:ABC transporter ATP-binding protein [Streptomyces spiroverticillatus]|uniref:ABC transporter ATP-binding protein n=1 Tax=Streptomyces finlayi TaxID=67296 RepID=A0A918X265_9ACTN|nr:ATP-binding cassette domain-containing protein [Streptomyces finlayi]GHA23721.1 ABC transporter ATP-binding protein [Streptomyces spiroverticillatus]GHD04913.1 ABC transporter ATP-binding protein [Streptomyces finlayi]